MLKRVTVAAWNVGHRAKRKSITEELATAVESLNADVVLLTEFVDGGEDRELFRLRLGAAGYDHFQASDALRGHNQVFAASRLPFNVGDIGRSHNDVPRDIELSPRHSLRLRDRTHPHASTLVHRNGKGQLLGRSRRHTP